MVVLPSPNGVGVIAVTRISLPGAHGRLTQQIKINLGFIATVWFHKLRRYSHLLGDIDDGRDGGGVSDLQAAAHAVSSVRMFS